MGASLLRWRLPFFTCWLLFVNHYARDIMGALEREIEAGYDITKADYGLLTSVYFIPNLVVPLVMGALAQRAGPLFVASLVISASALGHLLVGISASAVSFPCLLIGRAVLGVCYESIDILPLPILGKEFKESWAFLVGVFSGFLRSGSVFNFVLSPLIYRAFGLAAALWASSLLGLSGLPALAAIRHLGRRPACAGPAGSDSFISDAAGAEPVAPLAAEVSEATAGTCVPGRGELAHLPREFWLYCCTGMLMYAGIVPFWFFGSRYIQQTFNYSLEAADWLMLMPEGMIVILSPPVGIYVDRTSWHARKRLRGLAVALLFFPLAYVLLLIKWVPPFFSLLVLGSGWAFSNCLFWSLSAYIVPEDLLAVGSGIVGASLNVGATVLPYLMGHLHDGPALGLLVLVTAAAAVLAAMTATHTAVA